MRKKSVIVLLLFLLLLAGDREARAGITCTLPQVLQNGTVADATQVMANFNQLVSCFQNNIAASGANNDITGLFALTTPVSPSQGGSPIYQGAASSGGVNAQVIVSTVPAVFTLAVGRGVLFSAGVTNTGPMTLNVASSGALNVYRGTGIGPQPLSGGEIRAGNNYLVVYDGTQWQLVSPPSLRSPTAQYLTSGTGATYTTPPGSTYLEVRMYGAGGGGGGTGGVGGTGVTTVFGTMTAPGGTDLTGGAAGVNCTRAVPGSTGTRGVQSVAGSSNSPGGTGGNSGYGGGAGAGGFASTGSAAAANTGSGGGGGGSSSSFTFNGGNGGGSGAYCYGIIANPATTYTYTVGAGGTGGTGSFPGGAGGSGVIEVIEHYN